MKELKRISVNKFRIKDAISLEDLKRESKLAKEKIITIEKVFINNGKVDLDKRKLEMFLNGVKLTFELEDGIYRIYNNNEFIGLGIINNKLLKRDIIIA